MSAPQDPMDADGLQTENERLRGEIHALRRFIDSMQNVVEAAEAPRTEAEMMELLSDVLDNALQTIDANDGSLLVLDEDTDELVFVLSVGTVPSERLAWRRLPRGAGIAGWVAENRRATVVNDAQTDDRFYSVIDQEFSFQTRSIVAAPIIGAGRVLGVIEVLNKRDGRLFTEGDQTLLSLICRFAGELLYTVIRDAEKG